MKLIVAERCLKINVDPKASRRQSLRSPTDSVSWLRQLPPSWDNPQMSVNEGLAVKPWRIRYRWLLLLLVAIAGLVSWFFWPKSAMRERYERIRMGMTRAEVTQIMVGVTTVAPLDFYTADDWKWKFQAYESDGTTITDDDVDDVQSGENINWGNGEARILVGFRDNKVIRRGIYVHLASWQISVRNWLDWLRGLVEW
jgi:hypothetical protein